MLQLPSAPSRRRFTKAEIADITRGVKPDSVKARKRDPIIRLIARADAALIEYVEAINARRAIEETIPNNDWRHPTVGILDGMIGLYWGNGQIFSSENHIDREFRRASRDLKNGIRSYKAALLRLKDKKGQNVHQIRLERQQGYDSYKRKLENLPQFLGPMKKAFRKEERRVRAIHQKAGLPPAVERARKAIRTLALTTRKVSEASPTTAAGAIALVEYVETRLRYDMENLFLEEGHFPANLRALLTRARTVLNKVDR